MIVQHNMTALNANRYLGMNNTKLGKSLEKLSSGYAINRAGDNAAGLAVSEKMRSQIAGMTQGVKNAQDGISMVQTYEGALTETDSILQRMKTLATQSANGTYDDGVDRAAIELEYGQLVDEINQIADTDFNGVTLLNGDKMAAERFTSKTDDVSKADTYDQGDWEETYLKGKTFDAGLTLQVGARSKDAVEFGFSYTSKALGDLEADLDCSAEGLGLDTLSLATQEKANEA
ncbi:MAG: flagellin, partial [Oscillospiraceae bacterium]|nr:flagellin [Oscillospiraceae bacterium]